jgi:phosphoserine phosphatase RsbU/P
VNPTAYVLHVISGPTAGPFALAPDQPTLIGRSLECAVCLVHESVSRRHAQIVRREGQWYIIDIGSIAGTYLGSLRLEPNRPSPIGTGDLLRVGPWTLRLSEPGTADRAARTLDDTSSSERKIETLTRGGSIAASRLSVLTEGLDALHQGGDEYALATAALHAALNGTGCVRGAVLRTVDGSDEVHILSSADPSGGAMIFSRSLIAAASSGRAVILSEREQAAQFASLAGNQIATAICAPVLLGGSVVALIYLDARLQDHQVLQDSGAFCEAISRMLGLALANRARHELAFRQAQLGSELQAAREVQQFIMPAPEGDLGFVRYAMRSHAGAMVAGDLFDVAPLPDGRMCVSLGDVSGHGIGSAMLMAAVQAQLAAHLAHTGDVAKAMASVNEYLCARDLAGRFVSLVMFAIAPSGDVEVFDAGHGYWFLTGEFVNEPGSHARGAPLGIIPGVTFASHRFRLQAKQRLIAFSDGVVDERGHDGRPFGLESLRSAVLRGTDPASDITSVFNGLIAHSGLEHAGDDCTVASLQMILP